MTAENTHNLSLQSYPLPVAYTLDLSCAVWTNSASTCNLDVYIALTVAYLRSVTGNVNDYREYP